MDKMQEISNYINNVKIKKTFFGGYDREDVSAKMNELVKLFNEALTEEQEKQKAQIAEYENKIETSQLLVAEMNKKLSALMMEQKNAEEEKVKLKGAYKEYCSNILQQYSESLRTLSTEFSQILENISNLQKNMIDMDMFEDIDLQIEEETVPQIECEEEEIEIFER